jgi:hypothetical protein
MTMLLPRGAHFDALSATVTNPAALADIHADTEVPPDIVAWLKRLALLYGVPFSHIVPDEAMLPPESIRFFVVDTNWINALLEGACSIGRSSSSDLAHDAALAATIYQAVAPPASASGFLLRSAVVSGWPNLEVSAFANGVETGPPLRMERLAPTVLLYIAPTLIDRVEIHEPAEGLHFGIDIDSRKTLRWVSGAARGKPLGADSRVAVTFRSGTAGARTIAIAKLAADAGAALKKANARPVRPAPDDGLTAGEFALQLVEGVQRVNFVKS